MDYAVRTVYRSIGLLRASTVRRNVSQKTITKKQCANRYSSRDPIKEVVSKYQDFLVILLLCKSELKFTHWVSGCLNLPSVSIS